MALALKQTNWSWNQIKGMEINPHTYGHFICDKEARKIQSKKTKESSTNSIAQTDYLQIEGCK